MATDFQLPHGALRRFGVVKLWPEIKNAEDECIARLKLAAHAIGVECVEVDAQGRFLESPELVASNATVDFVIHLHYDTPKLYDAFSFVALWNPLKFYHEWGYARTSRNLTTHDDFISCSSGAADAHVERMIRTTGTHLPPKFKLYHSTASILFEPSLGDGKLAYAGINWDALQAGKSRHQEVLKQLDGSGLLRIYGPKVFMGVQVWAGYNSYVTEVPFDGESMVGEIHKAGAGLVLSSAAHKDAGIMSNRLFETLAAGALVICDENPFAKRFFGDTLLYIDGRASVDQIVADIKQHLAWAQANPAAALEKIASAQAIFREGFNMIANLQSLYAGLSDRKEELVTLQRGGPCDELLVAVNYFMPEYDAVVLERHLNSARNQTYTAVRNTLVVDAASAEQHRSAIQAAIQASGATIMLCETDYVDRGLHGDLRNIRRLGKTLSDLIGNQRSQAGAFIAVAPNEMLYSNHVSTLASALLRDGETAVAATAAVLLESGQQVNSVHELIDFGHVNRAGPPGMARFIFRMDDIPPDIDCALPYLDGRALAVLVGEHSIRQLLPATVEIDLSTEFPARTWDESAENEVIGDFSAGAFRVALGVGRITNMPQTVYTPTQLARKMLSRHWLKAQLVALRQQGWRKRWQAFRLKVLS